MASKTRPRPGRAPNRGVALILSLSSLALLSALGFMFVTLAGQEARASASHLEGARARMLALAGIDYAVARLRVDAGWSTYSDPSADWRYGGGPLPTTTTPSFRAGFACGHTYSCALGGTHAPLGDQAVLKVIDTGAQLHLNLPVPALAAMLDTLGRAISDERVAQGLPPLDPIAGRGAQIVALRDAMGGFQTKDSIRAVLGDTDYDAVRDYVTASAWIDPHTIAPTGGSFPEQIPAFTVEPRAPVNVNSAPKPVLVAVLADLRGPSGRAIPYATAGDVADAILARRAGTLPGQGPFSSWSDFYAFVSALTLTRSRPLAAEWAAVILANADPNFHSARLNPERVVSSTLDKTDLQARTTEFSLRGMGLYEITSLGRMFLLDGRETAEAEVTAIVRAFGILYHTVQADFERNRVSSLQENATTWPNPPARAGGSPAAWAGHIQCQTDRPARDPLLSTPTLEVLLRNGLEADLAAGSPRPVTTQEAGPDVTRDGDLFPDGLFFSNARRELTGYSTLSNVNPHRGGLEFWVKFDERATTRPVTVLLLTVPENAQVGVQHRIRASIRRGTLTVESTRVFYVSKDFGPKKDRDAVPSPYTNKETTAIATVPGAGEFHEWHRIAVSWTDGTDQSLAVDGVFGVVVSASSGPGVSFEGWPPYNDLLVIGGAMTASDGLEESDATVDDLRVYGPPGLNPSLGEPRSRFEDASSQYVGRLETAFDPLPRAMTLLGVAWTEWDPDSWSGRPFATPPAHVKFSLATGAGMVTVSNGAGADELNAAGVAQVAADQPLRYEVQFVREPGAVPLNVTPVFDDVIIAYATSEIETLSFTWRIHE